jgi:hypothetical protein
LRRWEREESWSSRKIRILRPNAQLSILRRAHCVIGIVGASSSNSAQQGEKQMRNYARQFMITAVIATWFAVGTIASVGRAQQEPPREAPARETEGVETLTRGPVHEAFAAPAAADPEPGEVVEKKPPEPIREEAPDYKPEGAIWIPGYWDWDVATQDYLWISGLWRVPPPAMRWVPPYWAEASGGWQRVPGFWVSADSSEVAYHQTPPESLEVGPSTPSPGDNYFYVPGTWAYYDSGFRWRTGYWSPYRDNFVWSPSRWIWTPAGCVYTAGYWDYQPGFRGQLFAPIYFRSPVYLRAGWRYRPWCVIDISRFFAHLWIGPRAHSYYFGNYYGPWSQRWGFYPWCDWNYRNRRWYDPLWAWSSVHYRRRGIDYIGRIQGWHRYYDRNERERPARTWDEQRTQIADSRVDRARAQNILADELREVARREDSPLRLTRLDERQRESVREVAEEIRRLHSARSREEREARVARADDADGRRGRGDTDRPATDDPGARRPTPRLRLPAVSTQARNAAAGVNIPARPDADRGDDEAPRTARRPEDRPRAGREDRPGAEAAESRPERGETRPRDTDRGPAPDVVDRTRREPGEVRPKADEPRVERAPRPASPRPEASPRERARTERPPAAERPRAEAPRVEQPRFERPRVEQPRAEPREVRPSDVSPRRQPRVETPRTSSRSRPEGSRDSGRSRDRDRDDD